MEPGIAKILIRIRAGALRDFGCVVIAWPRPRCGPLCSFSFSRLQAFRRFLRRPRFRRRSGLPSDGCREAAKIRSVPGRWRGRDRNQPSSWAGAEPEAAAFRSWPVVSSRCRQWRQRLRKLELHAPFHSVLVGDGALVLIGSLHSIRRQIKIA